jgi:hypothetical protein
MELFIPLCSAVLVLLISSLTNLFVSLLHELREQMCLQNHKKHICKCVPSNCSITLRFFKATYGHKQNFIHNSLCDKVLVMKGF